jgi:osmotically-inducible protein OsmY
MPPQKEIHSDFRPYSELEEKVFQRLSRQHYPALRKLSINVDLGKVVVSGTVGSFYERQLATNLVRQVAGVDQLTDEITVRT